MMFLDAFVRFSGVAILLLMAGLVIRDAWQIKNSHYLIGMSITVSATLIGYTPETMRLSEPLLMSMRFLDIPNLIFVWFFSLSLFNDEFELKIGHWLVSVLYIGLVVILRLGQFSFIPLQQFGLLVFIDILALLIVGNLVLVIVRGRHDDLLEVRRKRRFYFAAILAGTIFLYTLADVLLSTSLAAHTPSIKAVIILPSILWAASRLLRLSPQSLMFEQRSELSKVALSEREQRLADKLQSIMEGDKIYLKSGLTIEDLATQIGSTEHALRALINGRLGHRHFSSYVNSMRVEHVKQDFLNQKKIDIPILTIALDAGFNSISPFNRSFKKIEGITPSKYRQELSGKHHA